MNSDDSQNSTLSVNQISSGIGKEKEVIRTKESPYIKELGKEQEIPPEVKKVGVVVRKEHPEVPPDMIQIGVQPTGLATPVPFTPTLKLPISDEKIEEGRQQSVFSSLRWLAELCLFILKRFHLTLKIIHGRVMRVRYK